MVKWTWVIALAAIAGCTGEPPPREATVVAPLVEAAPPGSDAPPRTTVELGGRSREAIAEVRLGDSIAYGSRSA